VRPPEGRASLGKLHLWRGKAVLTTKEGRARLHPKAREHCVRTRSRGLALPIPTTGYPSLAFPRKRTCSLPWEGRTSPARGEASRRKPKDAARGEAFRRTPSFFQKAEGRAFFKTSSESRRTRFFQNKLASFGKPPPRQR